MGNEKTYECEIAYDSFISVLLSIPKLYINGDYASTSDRYELVRNIMDDNVMTTTRLVLNGNLIEEAYVRKYGDLLDELFEES